MNILIVSSEVAPFAKTGGLADVAGALPHHVQQLGHDVVVIMPLYRRVRQSGAALQPTGIHFDVPVGTRSSSAQLHRSVLPGPGPGVPIYFVENDLYYDRDGLYGTGGGHDSDYPDNSERFIFFTRAVLEACQLLDFAPDVIHCNDWQTGLLPVYVKTIYSDRPHLGRSATLYTIHNLAYQGMFWHWDMKLTGLDWYLFNWRQLEYFGSLNFMKGGIVFADLISTVSKQYAREIQTPEYGVGLHDVLKERSSDLYGIINGVDYSVWSPDVDEHIAAKYSAHDLSGKAACKAALQKANNLPVTHTPLIGIVSRLDKQKGFDILSDAIEQILALDVQVVLLGTGDPKYHKLFETLAERHARKIAVNLTFNNKLAHQIEAGSDMFLMPSRYEPCGLNQLYSLKYGTVPIVRRTGGLADTIINATPQALASGTATGFSFGAYAPAQLLATVRRAVDTYADKDAWAGLVQTCMAQDWSWDRSAAEYVELYRMARAKVGGHQMACR